MKRSPRELKEKNLLFSRSEKRYRQEESNLLNIK
jgi:hypothetical protein